MKKGQLQIASKIADRALVKAVFEALKRLKNSVLWSQLKPDY